MGELYVDDIIIIHAMRIVVDCRGFREYSEMI